MPGKGLLSRPGAVGPGWRDNPLFLGPLLCRSPVLSSESGPWETLALTLSRLSPMQAGPLALGILKLQDW